MSPFPSSFTSSPHGTLPRYTRVELNQEGILVPEVILSLIVQLKMVVIKNIEGREDIGMTTGFLLQILMNRHSFLIDTHCLTIPLLNNDMKSLRSHQWKWKTKLARRSKF